MAKPLTHEVRTKSWWSGRATALCGLTCEAGDYTTRWFAAVTCPACKALMREAKRR